MEDRKQILIDRAKERKTLAEIGKELGISRQRVKQLYDEYGIEREKGYRPSKLRDSIHDTELHYLAGLFEGEGTFRLASGNYPAVRIGMTDRDVIENVRDILGLETRILEEDRGEYKTMYRIDFRGQTALDFMNRIYPLMGNRRRDRINEVRRRGGLRNYEKGHHG